MTILRTCDHATPNAVETLFVGVQPWRKRVLGYFSLGSHRRHGQLHISSAALQMPKAKLPVVGGARCTDKNKGGPPNPNLPGEI